MQGFVKMHKDSVLSCFGKSYLGGLIVSAAGGERDQDYGTATIPLPENIGLAKGKGVGKELGSRFQGLVPLNRQWTKFGVRVSTADPTDLVESRALINKAIGVPAAEVQVVVNVRYVAEFVPRGVAKHALVRRL